jgi:restriction system protein
MSDAEFEQRVADLLRAAGYQSIQHVGEPGRQGIDIVTRDRNGHLFLVQVQQYAPGDRAGSIDMQELINAVVEEKAAGGIFVTTATFTQAAINLAQYSRVPIVLYDGAALSRLAARPTARSWSAA